MLLASYAYDKLACIANLAPPREKKELAGRPFLSKYTHTIV
jgi:hypothetical protein